VEPDPQISNSVLDGRKKFRKTKGSNKPLEFTVDYVIAYPQNLRALAALNLSASELKVVVYLLEAMEWGNLIGFSQKAACEALAMKKSNMSTVFKKLHDKGVIVQNGGHMYINSNLFAKGLKENMYPKTREHLIAAQGETNGIERAHDYKAQPKPRAETPDRVVPFQAPTGRTARPATSRRGGGYMGRADGVFRMPL
jgi:hypothetical protein